MVNKLTAAVGMMLLGSSLAFAGQNAATPTTTPQGNSVTAPASRATAGKAHKGHHKGKKHHKHQKQNRQNTTTSR
jgi:hypothetical protein